MCGIAGYIYRIKLDGSALEDMIQALFHRGPDGKGTYESGAYRVGMRRLSINDLEGGDQPLYNEDKSVVLLYNGEIYNSPELRRDLVARGHEFRTNSDGEVICHLYEEVGEEVFEQLDGMFAAALWIAKEQKLIMARDIPGEKPLYYAQLSENEIAFSSEIKSLVKFKPLNLTLDHQAMWDFPSFLWVPEPRTIYNEIKALLPGHKLVVGRDGISISKYANNFNTESIELNDESVVAETRRVVEESIKSRLLSDVPLGAFLSGGLDSSIIAGIASRHLDELSTFTIGFENLDDPYHGKADESEVAAEYAKYLGTKHHTIRVTGKDFSDLLPRFCEYGDQPFAVSSGLGILAVAREAQQAGLKVLLSGDGADECFGGYSWYAHLGNEIFHAPGDSSLDNGNLSFQNFGETIDDRLKVLAGMSPQRRAWAWHYYASEKEKGQLFSTDLKDSIKTSTRYFDAYNAKPNWTPEDFISQDRRFYFPFEMLRKVDRLTSSFSIEGRVPFAAPAVLSHADKLEYRHMVSGKHLKWVLRKAFSDILPEEVFNRPKHGFNVPIDHWIKSDWKELFEHSFSRDSALAKHGFINSKALERANLMRDDSTRLNGHSLFCYMMLNMWLENHAQI